MSANEFYTNHMTTFLCHVTTSFGHHVISFLQPTVQIFNGGFTTLVILIVNSRHKKRYSEDGKKFRGCRSLLGRVISTNGRNPFNQNFRAEVRKFLGVEWIATGSNGLVPFHSQNEFQDAGSLSLVLKLELMTISKVISVILCDSLFIVI